MAGLSQRLFALGRPNLERQLAHPTVRGIANGDLDQPRFRSWLVQDYLFLLDYVRLFALAAARAADTDTLGRLVDLAHATFHEGHCCIERSPRPAASTSLLKDDRS